MLKFSEMKSGVHKNEIMDTLASMYRWQHASTRVISRVFSVIFNRRTSLYASFIFLENP
jgi:hypothetical protein